MTTDLFLTRRTYDQMASDRMGVDLAIEQGDLKLVRDRDNLAQAVINRLLTRRGELADLGHPDYGSRLYQLIGEPNNRRTLAVAELYIREALADESRIQAIASIGFSPSSPHSDKRSLLDAMIVVYSSVTSEPLAISLNIPI